MSESDIADVRIWHCMSESDIVQCGIQNAMLGIGMNWFPWPFRLTEISLEFPDGPDAAARGGGGKSFQNKVPILRDGILDCHGFYSKP